MSDGRNGSCVQKSRMHDRILKVHVTGCWHECPPGKTIRSLIRCWLVRLSLNVTFSLHVSLWWKTGCFGFPRGAKEGQCRWEQTSETTGANRQLWFIRQMQGGQPMHQSEEEIACLRGRDARGEASLFKPLRDRLISTGEQLARLRHTCFGRDK